MKRIKENLSEQGILFSNHYVGDRLSEDDEVYLFNNLIDKLDISKITQSYSPEGGSMFSPRDHLAVICYAFYKGISSSVKIAELVRNHLQFIYLAGGHIIKRRTICDFRLKHGSAIRKIFESSVNLALESGLIKDGSLFALDGSKIEANAGFSKTRSKKEWKERQEKIVEYVDDFLRRWEEQDELEEDYEEKRKEEFEKIKSKLDKIKKGGCSKKNKPEDEDNKNDEQFSGEEIQAKKDTVSKNKAIINKNKIKIKDNKDAYKYLEEYKKITDLLSEYSESDDDIFLNITDTDCRIMKSDSITKECYNAQIIANTQVIVAADITQDENDQFQLKPLVEQLKKNLEGKYPGRVMLAADAGYNRGKNLSYIDEDADIDAYISMYDRSKTDDCNKENSRYDKESFIYDEEDDSWECPEGNKLDFIKEYASGGTKYTRYGCQLRNCIFCSKRDKCIKTKADIKRGYRTLDDDGYVVFRKEMKEKMSKDKSKKIYSKRAGCVEPVFGQIKNNRGFSRFRLKGLSKVKTEFLYMALAHNLGKIMKHFNRVNYNILANSI